MASYNYQYQPVEYIPQYAPVNLDAFTKGVQGMQETYDTAVADKDKLEIMKANLDVDRNSSWIKDDITKNVDAELQKYYDSGRWQDAYYVIPEIYRKYIGTNKDLIHAMNQKKIINETNEMFWKNGGDSANYNFAREDDFSSVEINPETGERKYNYFTPGVDPKLDPDAKLDALFNEADGYGYTGDITGSSNELFLQYITQHGLDRTQLGNIMKGTYDAFRNSNEGQQMYKRLTSRYYDNMDKEAAENYMLNYVKASGERHLGSRNKSFIQDPMFDLEKIAARGAARTVEGIPVSGQEVLGGDKKRNLLGIGSTLNFGKRAGKLPGHTVGIGGDAGKLRIVDGKYVINTEDVKMFQIKKGIDALSNQAQGKGYLKSDGLGYNYYEYPNLGQKAVIKNLEEQLKKQGYTGEKLQNEVARRINDNRFQQDGKNDGMALDYYQYDMNSTEYKAKNSQLIYSNDKGQFLNFKNLEGMTFYDPSVEGGTISGDQFIEKHFGKNKVSNAWLAGEIPEGESNTISPFYGTYVVHITDTDGKTKSVLVAKNNAATTKGSDSPLAKNYMNRAKYAESQAVDMSDFYGEGSYVLSGKDKNNNDVLSLFVDGKLIQTRGDSNYDTGKKDSNGNSIVVTLSATDALFDDANTYFTGKKK